MRRQGFTLFEIAIVIMIIALLAAGVVVGQSMVRTSQIRAALGEYDSYVKAIKEFQDKYMALPGDMGNAQTLWGVNANGACATIPTNYTTPTSLTCNGDGNGHIGDSTTAGVASNQLEWWLAWQHLADAGFISGFYTGTYGSAGNANEAKVGVNVPASKLDGAGWTLRYFLMTTADTGLWRDTYGHIFSFGAYTSTDFTKNPVLTSDEAMGIDSKIDDGKPGTGNVRAWRTSVLASCTNNDTTQTAETYVTGTSTSKVCSLVFLLGF